MLDSKKPLIISAIILGAAFLVSLAIIAGPKLKIKAPPASNTQTGNQEKVKQEETSNFPISLSDPSIGQAFVHYFINGKIAALESGNNIIVLDNASLPKFTLSGESRVSKLTPPYGAQSSMAEARNELKAGLNIIISAEYDLRSKAWIVRDVYIPTDKN